jgi:hypothetical protein
MTNDLSHHPLARVKPNLVEDLHNVRPVCQPRLALLRMLIIWWPRWAWNPGVRELFLRALIWLAGKEARDQ